jgi:N-acyl homoserine lactone hydrolase
VRVRLLKLAEIKAIGAPVPAYVVECQDGSAVLIDTGPPPAAPGVRMPPLRPEEPLLAQLGRIGIAPGDVRYVICTHLDPDHSGGLDLFPRAEVVIQRGHLAAARSGAVARLLLTRPHWDAVRFREVDGDCELLPGIELIESSGHVPGHQSVLLRLPNTGQVLLAADAIPMQTCLDADTRPVLPFYLDKTAVRASTRRLVALAEAESALVICGHDPVQWPTLATSPAYYD